MIFPGVGTVKGLRLRSNRRAAGAPFTVTTIGKTMRGAVGRASRTARSEQPQCQRARNGGPPPAWRKRGQPPGVGRRDRQRPRARGRGLADATGADRSRPLPVEALALVVISAALHTISPALRVFCSLPAQAEAAGPARRRCALE
jgi:hypothetical protein